MAKTYETILSVLDRFSAPILGLEDRLHKLGNTGAATQKRLRMSPSAKLWNELTEHVNGAKESFDSLGEHVGEMGKRLADVLPMLGAVGAGASVAGILEMAHATAEAAEALHNMSVISGLAVPQLQALDFAGAQVGVTSDQLGLGLERLNVSMGQAAEGRSKQAAALFHAMGISLRDANGHVKSATEILPQLEASFEKTKDPALRAAMAMQLFGRSGEDLLPLLTQGPAAIAKLQEQFSKFGYTFSDADQEGLESFNDAWKDATLSVQGLSSEIGAKLAPVMTPLLEDFANFVARNRDLIALDLKGALATIGDEVGKIDFKTISQDVETFVTDAGDLIDRIGGLQTVMIAGGAIMAASFLAPVLELTTAFIRLGVSMGAAVLGPVVALGAGFIELIPEVKSFRDVMAALDLAMDANPLGVLVIAAAAAGAAAYELYEHWDTVSKGLSTAWHFIGTEFDKVFGPIEKTLQAVGNGMHDLENFGFGGGGGAGNGKPTVGASQLPGMLGYNADNGASASSGGQHELTVNVNAPPGTTVSSKTTGNAATPVVNLGTNGTIANHR